jgi:Tfp pilus assembly protein PilX
MNIPFNSRSACLKQDERGIALVIALFLTLAMSAIGASMMFLSQTESYSSMNYRMMSQARYGAESGIQAATNFFGYTTNYTPPSSASGTDPMSNYDTTKSPVQLIANGKAVVLSSVAGQSNYPVASVVSAYAAAAGGSFQNGNVTVSYAPTATLVSMQEIPAAQAVGGAAFTIQTWQIVSDGTITAGTRNAKVEVTANYDTQLVSSTGNTITNVLMPYAAFAASSTCGAISLSGGATTNAYTYNGSSFSYTYNGNVGTNGNLADSGGATIDGTLSTPRSGVGTCTAGNVDGLTSSGGAEICPTQTTCSTTGANGGLVHLSQSMSYTPIPAGTNGTGSNISQGNGTGTYTDTALGLPPGQALNYGDVSLSGGGTLTLGPGAYGNLNVSGGGKLHLQAGTYDINSITESGGVNLYIDSGPVILNVTGTGNSTPISLSGGAMCCYNGGSSATTTYDSSQLQIEYAGTGTISLSGGTAQNAVIYAPNAKASLSGGTNFYGAMIVGTINDSGGAQLHYDTALNNKTLFPVVTSGGTVYQTGNSMLSAFSWTTF